MQKALVTTLKVITIFLVASVLMWSWRWHIAYEVAVPLMLSPSGEVEPTQVLDFGDEENWAALPWRDDDPSDQTPTTGATFGTDADVFYIHPTTYLSADSWNVPLGGLSDTALLEDVVLRDQPSAFNECCRVFAPYYQQATFFAFVDRGPRGLAALESAYRDVRAAFRHYAEQWHDGRPLVIAAHSQGTLHAIRLIEEEILGTPLEARLIVAYLPGYQMPQVGALPICQDDAQTGCALTWNNVSSTYWLPDFMYELPQFDGTTYSRGAPGRFICAPPEPDAGAYTGYHAGWNELMPAFEGAECNDGLLAITSGLNSDLAAFPMSRGWWHVYEYAHMWVAIGHDLNRRLSEVDG